MKELLTIKKLLLFKYHGNSQKKFYNMLFFGDTGRIIFDKDMDGSVLTKKNGYLKEIGTKIRF